MLDNFNETLNAIRRFIYANVPQGINDSRLESQLEASSHYFPLEFRRDNVSCSLYIQLDSFGLGDSIVDENGDRYRRVAFEVKPSWPSYGSVDVAQAFAFVKLIGEVTEFAARLLATFDQPIIKLVETAAHAAARKQQVVEEKCRAEVRSMMRANVKGMRRGQQRCVEVEGADLLPVGLVELHDGSGRHYTTHVTSTRAFHMTRTS